MLHFVFCGCFTDALLVLTNRLGRYYKKAGKLAPTWKYESATASAIVQ